MQYITPFIFRIRNYLLLLLMLYTLNGFAQYPGWQQYINRDDIDTMVDDGNQLWIACAEGGILLFNKIDHTVKHFDKYNSELSKTLQPVTSICLLKPGTIVFGSNNLLYTFNGTSCQIYNESLPTLTSTQIEVYNDTIYSLYGNQLTKINNSSYETILLPFNQVATFLITQDGAIWIGSNYNGFGKLKNGTWQIFTESEAGFPIRYPKCIIEDLSGNIWFGTEIDGLIKYDGSQWFSYTSSNSGIIGNHVESMTVNNDNILFFSIGHSGFSPYNLVGGIDDSYGIQQFDGNEFKLFNDSIAGFPCNRFHSMVFDKTRELLYLGGKRLDLDANCQGGFCSFDGLTSQIYDLNDCGIKESNGTLILADKNQNIWYADSYHGLTRYNNGTWTNYNPENSEMPLWYIESLSVDVNGLLWFGGFSYGDTNNCLNSFNGSTFNSYYYPDSLSIFYPTAITNTPDGKVWFLVSVYSSTPKLCYFYNGSFTEVAVPSGYYANDCEFMRSTDDGRIIIGLNKSTINHALGVYNGVSWEIIEDEITNSYYFAFTTYENDLFAVGSDGWNSGIFERKNNSWMLIKETLLNYGGSELVLNDDIIVYGYQVFNRITDTVYLFDPLNSPLQQWFETDLTIDQSNHIWWAEKGITSLDYTTLPTGVGVSMPQRNNLSIYPNPITPNMPFYTNVNCANEAYLEIYDVNGKLLFKTNFRPSEAIKPPSLNHGVYLVIITDNEGIVSTKLVVE